MPLENEPWGPMNIEQSKIPTPTPRQYRPTYGHLSSFGSIPKFGGPLSNQPQQGYNRRRTTSTFPVPSSLRSPPTIASSDLTASVSVGDISQPTPRLQRVQLPSIQAPSRIPTPTFNQRSLETIVQEKYKIGSDFPEKGVQDTSNDGQQINQFSRAVGGGALKVPGDNTRKGHKRSPAISGPVPTFNLKENMIPKPIRPIQLLPVKPSGLPKSRTSGVLAALASSISRSNPSFVPSCSASAVSLLAKSSTQLVSLPLLAFSDEAGQVSCHAPSSYWAGRFTALQDRYRNEILEPGYLETQKSKPWHVLSVEEVGSSSYTREAERLGRRAFGHLEALCLTVEAKASLWRFQQDYARVVNCEALLPVGGSMGHRDSFMAKARRMLPGGRKKSISNLGYICE